MLERVCNPGRRASSQLAREIGPFLFTRHKDCLLRGLALRVSELYTTQPGFALKGAGPQPKPLTPSRVLELPNELHYLLCPEAISPGNRRVLSGHPGVLQNDLTLATTKKGSPRPPFHRWQPAFRYWRLPNTDRPPRLPSARAPSSGAECNLRPPMGLNASLDTRYRHRHRRSYHLELVKPGTGAQKGRGSRLLRIHGED